MSENASNEKEKVFEFYLKLLPELRMEVIVQMGPKDRCRFTGCSRLCLKESKKSKNYLHGLHIYAFSNNFVMVHVVHCLQNENRLWGGYTLKFKTESDKKYLECSVPSDQELWKVELDSSIDLFYFATQHLKNMIQFYQNTIKWLDIGRIEDFDFGIRRLPNLEHLSLTGCENILERISTTQKPLKKLDYWGQFNQPFENYEWIFGVRDALTLRYANINYQQFLQLTASIIYIPIGSWTKNDIFNFIKTWQNGTSRRNLKNCSWVIDNSEFDIQDFFRLMGLEYNESERVEFVINHNKDSGKNAKLCYDSRPFLNKLTFEMD